MLKVTPDRRAYCCKKLMGAPARTKIEAAVLNFSSHPQNLPIIRKVGEKHKEQFGEIPITW